MSGEDNRRARWGGKGEARAPLGTRASAGQNADAYMVGAGDMDASSSFTTRSAL